MDLQKRLKAILQKKYQNIEDIILPINVCHQSVYDLPADYEEHYNRHIDLSHKDKVEVRALFPFEDLLKCDCNHSRSQKTILTFGACGIGKTTAVRQCALDWAEGRAHQHIDLMFPFECWELSQLREHEINISLIQLLKKFYPDLKELGTSSLSSQKVWFVFDELEDLTELIQFDCPKVSKVTKVAPMHTLLPNLIKGNLLPNAHIWVTTRYTAIDYIDSHYVLKETEMRGFNDEQKELHIRNLVGDDDLANRVVDHIKISRSLYYLCSIPYMCTAMATVLKKHIKTDDFKIHPMTLTQIYSSLMEELQSDILSKLKILASALNRDLTYYSRWIEEDDLKYINIPVAEASAFAREHPLVLREENSMRGVPLFCFAHISVWEYFNALIILEEETTNNPPDQFSACFQKVVNDVVRDYEYGQYDICLRFFFGLLKEREALQPSDLFFDNIRKKILEGRLDDSKLMLFHCLREFDSQALMDDLYGFCNEGRLPLPNVAPEDCLGVMLMIMNVEEIRKKFELELSVRCDERVLRSLPALLKGRYAMLRFSNLTDTCCPALASVLGSKESHLSNLDLGFNSITDAGVQSLVQGLKEPDCRLKSLSLQGCELTSSACEHLATALKQCQQMKELDLSCNDIGNVGLQHLAHGLESPNCQLNILRVITFIKKLSQCNVKKEGVFHLASALEKNPCYLKWLDLSINQIGNKAANELFTKLDISKLRKLEMYYCGLTARSCAKIAEALKLEVNILVELNLSNNDLKDSGVFMISAGLFAWSRLEKLKLSRCGITHLGCSYLSKVLSSFSALYTEDIQQKIAWKGVKLSELDLSMNKLTDAGAIHIFTGLKNPYSNLRKLNLSECSLTFVCCSKLAISLSSSECLVTELNLSSNIIQDRGVKKLCAALKSPQCALQKLFLRNCRLSSKCVPFLSTALQTNQCLIDLFLMGNKLHDDDIKMFQGMTKNDAFKLQTIDVSID